MDGRSDRPPRWVLITGLALSCVPLIIMLFTTFRLDPGQKFMWELQYDQFYYAANAKALLGNGKLIFHANAYDDRSQTPRIYSHLYTTLLALLGFVLRITPFYAIFILRPIFGVALAWSLWYFLSAVFSDMRWRSAAWMCLMFSGGVAGVAALASGILSFDQMTAVTAKSFFENEGTARDWLCSIARVYMVVPEMLYHAIWFFALGAYLGGRRLASTVLLALELYAHPFTGPELGLVLAVACLLDAICGTDRKAAVYQLIGVTALLLFFALYAQWLGLDSGHRILVEQWGQFKSAIPVSRYPFIYGIWLPLGIASIIALAGNFRRDAAYRLMLIQAVVVFLLSHHHWFAGREFQPAHFSRGYLFSALVILSFKWLCGLGVREVRPKLFASALALLSLDSAFYYIYVAARAGDPPMTVMADRANMVRQMEELKEGHFIASDPDIGYLVPVFSNHKVLLGHFGTTPGFQEKWRLWRNWILSGDATIFERYPMISIVIMPHSAMDAGREAWFKAGRWNMISRNSSFIVYHRIP